MVAFAEPSRPTRRAPARQCGGSAPCAPGKTPTLRTDRNQQYSITALTNASGTITERYSYSAYGQPVFLDGSGTAISASAESNRMMYTGREWDDGLGLYHYRARMYDAVSGRFLGRDPIEFEGSKWNLYEYVNASPLTRNDPQGLGWGKWLRGCDDYSDIPPIPRQDLPCDGKISSGAEATYELCVTMCKVGTVTTKDPTDACGYCKKLGGPLSPARRMCEWICGKANLPTAKDLGCREICCLGALPEGLPSAPCIKILFENGPVPGGMDVLKCTGCCESEFPHDFSARSLCNKACNGNAAGR